MRGEHVKWTHVCVGFWPPPKCVSVLDECRRGIIKREVLWLCPHSKCFSSPVELTNTGRGERWRAWQKQWRGAVMTTEESRRCICLSLFVLLLLFVCMTLVKKKRCVRDRVKCVWETKRSSSVCCWWVWLCSLLYNLVVWANVQCVCLLLPRMLLSVCFYSHLVCINRHLFFPTALFTLCCFQSSVHQTWASSFKCHLASFRHWGSL